MNPEEASSTAAPRSAHAHGHGHISGIAIAWSFISLLLSAADITAVLVLAYFHFIHSNDMMAWIMLMPILLNFIGIFAFFSNDGEREEMERLAPIWKQFIIFPVIGPTVGSLRLFLFIFDRHNAASFERLESLLIKMKQYEAFFRAAPEAFIQITFRIVNWKGGSTVSFTSEDSEEYWVSACIALSLFALAESNIYATILPAYYRLFNYTSAPSAWNVDSVAILWRLGLFFFNYQCIASRLFTDALFRATACFYFPDIYFGEVIILTFIAQFVGRALVHAVYQNTLARLAWTRDKVGASARGASRKMMHRATSVQTSAKPPEENLHAQGLTGVYGAITYSWRCLFMSFDFQDWSNPIVYYWFYVENVLTIGGCYAVTFIIGYDLTDTAVYFMYTASACFGMVCGLALKPLLLYYWRKQQGKEAKVALTMSTVKSMLGILVDQKRMTHGSTNGAPNGHGATTITGAGDGDTAVQQTRL